MKLRSRVAVSVLAVVASTAAVDGAASARASRLWHGIPIQPLNLAPAFAADALPSGAMQPAATRHKDQILSNERTFTRWAYVARIAPIYAQPSTSSKRVTRLHWYTEDGFPEVYLLLRSHWDSHDRQWINLRIPMRPNGRTGWVPGDVLSRFHLTHTLVVVNRERLRMYIYMNGRKRWSAPVGVGKPSTPTPAGHFWIRERFRISNPGSGYWPYAFGTADYSTLSDWPGGGVVGIHGPYYQPQAIPGRISHGCIRLHRADDAWLAHHIELGTPLHVV